MATPALADALTYSELGINFPSSGGGVSTSPTPTGPGGIHDGLGFLLRRLLRADRRGRPGFFRLPRIFFCGAQAGQRNHGGRQRRFSLLCIVNSRPFNEIHNLVSKPRDAREWLTEDRGPRPGCEESSQLSNPGMSVECHRGCSPFLCYLLNHA
jgi:hypothetical protein